MNGHKNGGANKNRISRTIKVSPTTRAIRSALAVSATLLALGGMSTATAGTCILTTPSKYLCTGIFTNSVEIEGTIPPVFPDLTVVIGLPTGGTSVTPGAGVTGISGTWGGDVGIISYADITTSGADGVFIYGSDTGFFENFGNVNTTITGSGQHAADITAVNDVTLINHGSLVGATGGAGNVTAINLYSQAGGITVDNQAGGIIIAGAQSGDAVGIYGDVANGGNVDNNGYILASSVTGNATGINVFSVNGELTVNQNGELNVATSDIAGGASTGINAFNALGHAVVTTGEDSITNVGGFGDATGITATSWFGGTTIDSEGELNVTSYGGNATGIYGYGKYADITNGGDLTVVSYAGNAIGMNAYGINNTSVTNTGSLTVFTSTPGAYAAGVIASGSGNITVNNSGSISVTSAGDGSGMGLLPYAEGADGVGLSAVSVYNGEGGNGGGGEGNPALFYGANDVNAINSNSVYVNVGGNGTGMNAVAIGAGNAYINNSGTVTVYAGGDSIGINGYVNGPGAYITAYNTGTVNAVGGDDGYGALLIADDGIVTMHNDAGTIGGSGYYHGGGIIAVGYTGAYISGDGGATADAGGNGVDGFYATAIGAYSFGGNASAASGGVVDAYVYAVSSADSVVAQGVYASSYFGNASAGATGSVTAYAGGNAHDGVTAIGVHANSQWGDASATTGEGSTVTATAYGYGFYDGVVAVGVGAVTYDGDASVYSAGTVSATATNDPSIAADNGAYAYGLIAVSSNGDVHVNNSGSVSATAVGTFDMYYGVTAVGISAQAGAGNVYVTSSGSVSATVSGGYSYYYGDATGIDAYSQDGTVSVIATDTGSITVNSTGSEYTNTTTGILAYSYNNDVTVESSANITVDAYDFAQGIYAHSYNGSSVSITTGAASDITVTSDVGSANGVYAYGKYADTVTVHNEGNITTSGLFANGIIAGIYQGGTIDVYNSGAVSATGDDSATALQAQTKYSADGDITVTNAESGSLTATGVYSAIGINASTAGIKYYSGNQGDISVINDGDITATATGTNYTDKYGDLQVAGTAIGIVAHGYQQIDVTNNGDITVNGYYGGFGVLAQGYNNDINVTTGAGSTIDVYAGGSYVFAPYAYGIAAVTDSGDITVTNGGSVMVEAFAGGTFYGGANATGVLANNYSGSNYVTNTGTIDVDAGSFSLYYAPTATGVSTYTVLGDTGIANNGGTISASAHAYYQQAYGIPTATGVSAVSLFGDQDLYNSGSISAYARAYNGGASATGVYMVGYYAQYVETASGSAINAHAYGGDLSEFAAVDAIGISAQSLFLDGVSIYNEGFVSVRATAGLGSEYSSARAVGVDAESTYNGTYLRNTVGAAITVSAYAGYGDGAFDNQADAYGVIAYAYGGGITIINGGSIGATAHSGGELGYANATGVDALIGIGGYGNILVENGGTISATAEDSAIGVTAVNYDGYGSYTTVRNYSESAITANASGGYSAAATGVYAVGYDVNGFNAGSVSAISSASAADGTSWAVGLGLYGYDDAYFQGTSGSSVHASANGYLALSTAIFVESADTSFATNAGGITSTAYSEGGDAYAQGIYASSDSYTGVRNYVGGSISATATALDEAGANAVFVRTLNDGHVSNAGSITASATGNEAYSYGIYIDGDVHAFTYNEGAVSATTTAVTSGYATGVYLVGYNAGFSNAFGGSSSGTASGDNANASGAQVTADGGTAWTYNEGALTGIAHGDYTAYAAGEVSYGNYAEFYGNIGSSVSGTATGTTHTEAAGLSITSQNDTSVYGEGAFSASASTGLTGHSYANALYAYGYDSVDVETTSTSVVNASATGEGAWAYGVHVVGYNAISVDNAAAITTVATATHGYTAGLLVEGHNAGFNVYNSGVINATFHGDGYATGMGAFTDTGNIRAYNYANITSNSDHTAIGVFLEGEFWTTLRNYATITANGGDYDVAVWGGDSNEYIYNYGTVNGALWTGDGDDHFYNEVGHTWNPGSTTTYMGDGDDSIVNNGTIHLVNSTIYMDAYDDDGNEFYNNGLITVSGTNYISMGDGPQALIPAVNPLPFNNDGTIDFQDGAADDTLYIGGDFAGEGYLMVDVSGLDADHLYIDGSIIPGTVQTVYVDLLELPDSIQAEIPLVYVTGDSLAGQVVLGDVDWDGTDSFVTLDFDIVHHDGNPDVFALGITATGLTDAGTLLASMSGSIQSLMNSQIGTWRQRMGVIDHFNDGAVALWARIWQDKGGFSPEHVAANFGSGGNFDWDQKNSGVEAGIDFAVTDEFSLGLLVGKSQADTHIKHDGVGSSDIDGDTWGIYGTWISPSGFYLDASYRWMSFDIDMTSVIGARTQDGHSEAFNVEVGYAWTLSGGLKIEPQLQYTKVSVDDFEVVSNGSGMDFLSDGGDSSRGRLGVSLRKSFGEADSGWMWTPYATLSVIREFDGENHYAINNSLFGEVDMEGTSTLLELGFTANHQNWAIYGGLNWTDGGAVDNFFGGQLGVRYTFGAAPPPPPPPVVAPAKTCADLDDDGDGINNCDDKCLGSTAGQPVGADGCPVPAPEPEPVMEPKPFRG